MPNYDRLPLPDAEASLLVDEHHLASNLSAETRAAFPPVFATARMIGLMELAASRCLVPLLHDGELSVGVGVEVEHTAATPLGGRVTARARCLGQDGKLYRFEVVALDDGGEIGRGVHTRAIVRTERIVLSAAKRAPARDELAESA